MVGGSGAWGPDTCRGPTAALDGQSQTLGCLSSSHRAGPKVLSETSTPTRSCCNGQRGGPSRVPKRAKAQAWLQQTTPAALPGCRF